MQTLGCTPRRVGGRHSTRERKWAAGTAGCAVGKDTPCPRTHAGPGAPRRLPRWAGPCNGLVPARSPRPPVAPAEPSSLGEASACLLPPRPRSALRPRPRHTAAGSPAGASSCVFTQHACAERPPRTHTGLAPGLWSPRPQAPRVRCAPTGSSKGLPGGLELTVGAERVCAGGRRPPGRLPGGGGPELGGRGM